MKTFLGRTWTELALRKSVKSGNYLVSCVSNLKHLPEATYKCPFEGFERTQSVKKIRWRRISFANRNFLIRFWTRPSRKNEVYCCCYLPIGRYRGCQTILNLCWNYNFALFHGINLIFRRPYAVSIKMPW